MKLVPLDEIYKWLPQIDKMLKHFLASTPEKDIETETRDFITGHYRLWDLGHKKSIVVTQLVQQSGGNTIWVPWLYGKEGVEFDDALYNGLVAHAKAEGCVAIEFGIRRGFRRSSWAKKFPEIKFIADLHRIDVRG